MTLKRSETPVSEALMTAMELLAGPEMSGLLDIATLITGVQWGMVMAVASPEVLAAVLNAIEDEQNLILGVDGSENRKAQRREKAGYIMEYLMAILQKGQ